MSLKDLGNLYYSYNTYDENNHRILENFMIPCLKETVLYKRCTGFFNSNALLLLTEGIDELVKKNGKILLLVSPQLDKSDYDAIEKGYDAKKKLEEKVIDSFDFNVEFDQRDDRFAYLSYLIANNILEIHVVCMKTYKENCMFHVKKGIFKDQVGNKVYFKGSANSSPNGYDYNYEEIDVRYSWNYNLDDQIICDSEEDDFDRIWNDNKKGLITIPFPKVIKEQLIKYNKDDKTDFSYINKLWQEYISKISEDEVLKYPPNFKPREYQIKATENWKNNNYRGIFDMATGTGKTKTACNALCEIYRDKKRLFAIIIVPSKTLVNQWYDTISEFRVKDAIKYYSEEKDRFRTLDRQLKKFKHKEKNFVCLIITNSSFMTESVQNLIINYLKDTLIIVDEAHNFGANNISKTMELDFKYRLALSATFERYGDYIGTEKLFNFFGKKCIELTLEEAIRKGYLCQYKYYPILISLNEDELEEYIKLSKEIGKLFNSKSNSSALELKEIERARIVAGANNKIDALMENIAKYKDDKNLLVYCGTSTVNDDEIVGNEMRQIDLVTKKLFKDYRIEAQRFTSKEDEKQRNNILECYKNGDVACLVAIKCLDEGVDIPSIKTAFILASSTNPREYIQRRGRVLRLSKNKEFAEIYDFIVIPNNIGERLYTNDEAYKIKQSLVNKELKRVNEFARIAMNTSYSETLKSDLINLYRLDEFKEEEDIYE